VPVWTTWRKDILPLPELEPQPLGRPARSRSLYRLLYPGSKQKLLIDANKEVGLEVNIEETKYMLQSHHQNAGQNHNLKIANRCFEIVARDRYVGTTVTNQNLIQEEIKRRLNTGNAGYHSVQNLLSSRLLSKNVKIRIYKSNFACGFVCM
jgi:hypothetical protein